jgi:hypothetical protein
LASTRIKLTAYIVSIAYSVALLVSGLRLASVVSKILACLPTLIVLGFAVFDTWLWRLRGLNKLLKRPDLGGTWTGSVISRQTTATGQEEVSAPIEAVLTVRQTYTTISLTLMTPESKSRSVAEAIVRNPNGEFAVHYQYRNLPRLEVRDRSPEHSGSTALEIPDTSPRRIEGEYWTNRRTRGTLEFSRASRTIVGSFSDAAELANGQGK